MTTIRTLRRIRVLQVIAAFGMASAAIAWVTTGRSTAPWCLFAFLMSNAAIILCGHWKLRAVRAIDARRLMNCPHCGYDTSTIVSSDKDTDRFRCPECGIEQTHSEVARHWQAELRK